MARRLEQFLAQIERFGPAINLMSIGLKRHTRFSGNMATDSSGGLYNSVSSPNLTNSILWGNITDQVYGNAITVSSRENTQAQAISTRTPV